MHSRLMVSFVTPSIAFSAGLHISHHAAPVYLSHRKQVRRLGYTQAGMQAYCVLILTLAQASRILGYSARMLAVLKAVATDLRTAFQRSSVGPVSSV